MDLPTYTNIWRIEKRLYKLYDLRLPMPLPLVQIGVFIGVFVPWIVLLRLVGIPFKSPWHVLYLVPPGVLTWLATRPVIEGKRLTELLLSQARYLAEPRTWCRLTPIREPGEVVVVARVWRRTDGTAEQAAVPERMALRADRKARESRRRRSSRRATATVQAAAAHTAQAALGARPPQPLAGRPVPTPQTAVPSAAAAAPAPALPPQAVPPQAVPAQAVPALPGAARQRVRVTEQARRTGPAAPVEPPGPEAPVRPGATGDRDHRAVRPWRVAARDISHEPEGPPAGSAEAPEPAELERPPATPVLEVPPGTDQVQGSGKRAFASGVLRPGAAAEFWQAVPAGDHGVAGDTEPAGGESARAAAPGNAATGAEPREAAPVDTGTAAAASARDAVVTGIPMVPGAFGAAGGRSTDLDGGAETAAPDAAASVPDTQVPEIAMPEALSSDPVAAEAGVPEGAAPSATAAHPSLGERDEGREPLKRPVAEPPREPVQEPSVKPPPKPWSQELSRPRAGAPDAPDALDALVWPPDDQAGELPPRARNVKAVKPPPPQVVPERRAASPEPAGQDEAAVPPPAREVRSGPASPVRPRPLPQPTPPPAPGPAITPPDPEHEPAPGGLRRLLKAVGGGHADADAEWEERLQRPFQGTRHIVVLGCTGGAGQTVTALMLGHTFARHGGEPIVAIDVNPGPGALARRTRSETNETLTGLITRAGQVSSLTAMRRYTSRAKSGLDVIAAGKNPVHALDDRDYALAIRTIDRFYSVTLLDTAAAVVARVLPHADQLVLVAPASSDAPRAVAMTFEWLDGHGYDDLRSRAVTVINGVSRRSMDDVEQAEAVARGRCRALVRIPWDDHLSLDRSPRNELRSLRAPTRRAYLALAGVVAGGFGDIPERYREQEQEASR